MLMALNSIHESRYCFPGHQWVRTYHLAELNKNCLPMKSASMCHFFLTFLNFLYFSCSTLLVYLIIKYVEVRYYDTTISQILVDLIFPNQESNDFFSIVFNFFSLYDILICFQIIDKEVCFGFIFILSTNIV